MVFQEILPTSPLRPYVRNFLLVHLPVHHLGTFLKPYPVRIEQALVFFVRGHILSYNPRSGTEQKIPRIAIFGQQTKRLNFETHFNPDFLMLMVVFQPGMMQRFLHVPTQEFNDQFCNATSILGQGVSDHFERLVTKNSYSTLIAETEFYLTTVLSKTRYQTRHPIDLLGLQILNNPVGFSIDQLASDACLSPRQFQRRFKELYGIGPKFFMRINRYFNAFQYKEQNPHLDWSVIAFLFEYTDYSHLFKEFKEFGGGTPTFLLAEEKPENHVLNLLLPSNLNSYDSFLSPPLSIN